MQQVLTSWGTRYKRLPGFETDDKAAQPLAVRQGKEATEEFFATLVKNFQGSVLDMTPLTAAWNHTGWLWGYSNAFYSCGTSPNSGAIFRMVAMGQVDVTCVNTATLMAAWKQLGEIIPDMDTLCKKMKNMCAERMKLLQNNGADFKRARVGKEQLYYLPAGWLVLESTETESALVYGVRKSYFFKTTATVEQYKVAKNLLSNAGQPVSKMDAVLGLLEA
eukprot:4602895-Alexandrium_andersonii.AAC.1